MSRLRTCLVCYRVMGHGSPGREDQGKGIEPPLMEDHTSEPTPVDTR
jgi:hypothetical protein